MITLGIIGAMDEEVEIIKNRLEVESIDNTALMEFYICRYNGMKVIVVRSGIGKVNAAICTQVLIDRFSVDMVINTGVAGGVHGDLDVGDVVVSSDVVEHDMDTSALGDPVGQIPRMDVFSFKADEKLIDAVKNSAKKVLTNKKLLVGRIVSGDQFIADDQKILYLREKFDAYAVEMEGASIGHTCYVNKLPFVIIRSISDKADKSAHVDFPQFVREASKVSADLVMDIIGNII